MTASRRSTNALLAPRDGPRHCPRPCPLTAPRGRGGPWKAHLDGFDLHATDDRAGVARENPRDANEPNLPRPTPTLLVAECGDRIQTRRAARRVEAEEDADGARDQEGAAAAGAERSVGHCARCAIS